VRRTFSSIVSANYFNVLGVRLSAGRSFTADESRPGSEIQVAVASYALWRRTGFDPDLLGRTVRVNERPFTIVGITPKGFTGTSALFGPEIYFPLGVFDTLANDFQGQANRALQRPGVFNLYLVGRLKPEMTMEKAQAGLKLASAAAERAYPVDYQGQEFSVHPLPRFSSNIRPAQEGGLVTLFIVLLGMTASVLLIVCLNLASMLLARGQTRRREFAIRLALGGNRLRIVRQLLIEGLLLSLVGGGFGILLGVFALDALVAALLAHLPISLGVDAATSPAIVGGSALFAVLATLLFALGPALRHSGVDILVDLKQQAGEQPVSRRRRFVPRHPLLAVQVALSLSLLMSAGLFLRMARLTSDIDLGFRADNTVVVEVDAGLAGFEEARGLSLYAALEERLQSLPGVRSASVGARIPFGVVGGGEMVRRAGTGPAEGSKPQSVAEGQSFRAGWNAVGAAYFDTMGIALRSGRLFTDAEVRQKGAPLVALVDEVLANQLWPGGDAIGRSIEFEARSPATRIEPMEVIGIVPMVRDDFFSKSPAGAVYVPFAQGYQGNVFFHVRARDGAPATMADAVRREIRSAAPALPIFRATTFGEHVRSSADYWGLHTMANLFTTMGVLATVIALIGIYGAKSYAVLRRTREIGIRLAIGATPAGVRQMVLREGLRLGAIGVSLGLLLGLGMGQVLDSIFVDLDAFDPVTFTLAPMVLLGACIVASWLPARRATQVNPVTALRAD
jgi:predicted permease